MSAGSSRAADEIAAEIQETRARIDRTIDALEERLSPGQLLDTAIDYLRTRGRAGGARAGGGEGGAAAIGDIAIAMRENPIATALIGIGIGLVGVGLGALFASAVPAGTRGRPPLPGEEYDLYDEEEEHAEYDDRRRHQMADDVFVGPVER